MAQLSRSSVLNRSDSCLGRTCLKWSQNGELTALDLQLVLDRLCQVDDVASALLESSPLEGQSCSG